LNKCIKHSCADFFIEFCWASTTKPVIWTFFKLGFLQCKSLY